MGDLRQKEKNASIVRPRPAVLRALGNNEPPNPIQINSDYYELNRVFKHDSWAATALYSCGSKRIVCKFNRQQPIGPFSMDWLGKRLAARESYFLQQLSDLPNTPNWVGPVRYENKLLPHATAHEYIEGRPLRDKEFVADDFFPTLQRTLREIHRRKIAYVDLHKRENILVGTNGRPILIDFQICFSLPTHQSQHLIGADTILETLQSSDRYHLLKHWARCRPDTFPASNADMQTHRPAWIKAHRIFAIPYRSLRRWLLSRLRVRNHTGRAETELFTEEGLRPNRRAA